MTHPLNQDVRSEIEQTFYKGLLSALQTADRDDEAKDARAAQARAANDPTASPPDAPGRGRPRVLDEPFQKAFCNLLLDGFSQRRAARLLGVGIRTIQREIKRNPEFAAQIDNAVRQREINALRHIRQTSRQSWRAAAWLLERSCPAAYAPRRSKRSSATLTPKMIKQIQSLIDESLRRLPAANPLVNRTAHVNRHPDPFVQSSPAERASHHHSIHANGNGKASAHS